MDDYSSLRDDKRAKVRQKLSTMSFEDLLKLKNTLGTKLINESILGTLSRKQDVSFKRANKNRPREMSSKKKIKSLQAMNGISTAKPQARDPRFDPLCGVYDDKIFKQNYKFTFNIKLNELKLLQNELQNEENLDRKMKIKRLIQRLENQIREHQNKEAESKEIKETLTEGLKPVFKKKSEKRLEQVMEKYAKLKQSNTMKKYIDRKSKKMKKKEQERQPSISNLNF